MAARVGGGKQFLSTPHPFERRFGYHRAVRKGPFITVSGTTTLKLEGEGEGGVRAMMGGGQGAAGTGTTDTTTTASTTTATSAVHYPGDARRQALLAMRRCVCAVEGLGGRLEDVTRVRMFVSGHEHCDDVGSAYRECFAGGGEGEGDVGAAATMLVVKDGFVDPDILVEVEVDAICA